MRYYLLLLLFLLPLVAHSQLEGNYCHRESWTGVECFTLAKDKTFRYEHHSCTGPMLGMGVYKIRFRTLYLKFDTYDFSIENKFAIDSTNPATKGISNIYIRVNDLDGEPYPGSIFSIKELNDTTNIHSEDLGERCSIQIPLSHSQHTLEINNIFSAPVTIPFIPDKDYYISVYLQLGDTIGKGEVKKFRIYRIADNRLYLKCIYKDWHSKIYCYKRRKKI